MLIAKIFAEKELGDSVVKSYLTTAADGKRYNVIYYALKMILAVEILAERQRGIVDFLMAWIEREMRRHVDIG